VTDTKQPIPALVVQLLAEAASYEKSAAYFASTGRYALYDSDRGRAKVLFKAAAALEQAIKDQCAAWENRVGYRSDCIKDLKGEP
jgi:hypothetical protein